MVGQSCPQSDCKCCSWERGKRCLVRGMGIKVDIFNLSGRSDDHVQSPILIIQLLPSVNIAPNIYI